MIRFLLRVIRYLICLGLMFLNLLILSEIRIALKHGDERRAAEFHLVDEKVFFVNPILEHERSRPTNGVVEKPRRLFVVGQPTFVESRVDEFGDVALLVRPSVFYALDPVRSEIDGHIIPYGRLAARKERADAWPRHVSQRRTPPGRA